MKITKRQLRKLLKEAISQFISERPEMPDMDDDFFNQADGDYQKSSQEKANKYIAAYKATPKGKAGTLQRSKLVDEYDVVQNKKLPTGGYRVSFGDGKSYTVKN